MLPNKHVLQRSLVHLYPLEATNDDIKEIPIKNTIEPIGDDHTGINENDTRPTRMKRKAAQEARDKIYGQSLHD